MAVTGPKSDLWLVKTVGAVLIVEGIVFIFSGVNGEYASGGVLAVMSAAALAYVDIYYVCTDTIKWIYLLDAFPEIVLVILWLFALKQKRWTTSTSYTAIPE
jgi:hypothetical protein